MKISYIKSYNKEIKSTVRPSFKSSEERKNNSYPDFSLLPVDSKYHKKLYEDMNLFKQEDYPLDKILSIFSKAKIYELLNNNVFADKAQKYSQVETLYKKLDKGDVESSNIEMLMDLVKEGEISVGILNDFPKICKTSKRTEDDIDKLYCAKIEGKPLKDIFIPEYTTESEAKNNMQTGDICSLKNEDNIRIKLKNGELKEIFLSPQKYLKLFPPIERYSYVQGSTNDCYLIAAISSLYFNPAFRYKVLELFKENKDGSISMSLNGFKREGDNIVPNDSKAFIYNVLDEPDNDYLYSVTCPAIKYIENFFEANASYNADRNINEQYNTFKYALNQIENCDAIYIDELKYTKKELQEFIDLVDDYRNNPQKNNKMLIDLNEILAIKQVNRNFFDSDSYEYIEDKKSRQYIANIYKRFKDYFDYSQEEETILNVIVPSDSLPCFFDIDDDEMNQSSRYINLGGNASMIFDKLNIQAFYCDINTEIAQKFLKDPKSKDNCVIVAGALEENKEYGIISGHSYSVEPIDIDNERKFIVEILLILHKIQY